MKKMSDFIENNIESVSCLGDGEYSGIMSGWTFNYQGKKYKCSFGVRGINCPMTIKIKNGKDSQY